jgi:hypothetical protein
MLALVPGRRIAGEGDGDVMLDTIGRMSAMVVIAGGALLLRPESVLASAALRPCDVYEQSDICQFAQTASYYDGEWWCGQFVEGSCFVDDEAPGGPEYTFNVQYYSNGQEPCPAVQPC